MGDNSELLKKTLTTYMQAERPAIEQSIISEIGAAKEHDDTERGKNKAAANVILNRAKGELNNTLRDIEGYGIKMNVDIVSSDKVWYPSKNNTIEESRNESKGKEDDERKRRQMMGAYRDRAGYTR